MSNKSMPSNIVQVSAGGVAFRTVADRVEVALISVGEKRRWQLPKGLINQGETNEAAAVREVREETGLVTDLIALIDKIEYWFYATEQGQRVRIHKFVYFYLVRYTSGNVEDHDQEVNEVCWFALEEARKMLAFESEQAIVAKAQALIKS